MSDDERQVHVLDALTEIYSAVGRRVGAVVADIAGPEEVPDGDLCFGLVGLDRPGAFDLVFGDWIEEVHPLQCLIRL
jgi:hypothetical protein